MNIFFPPNQQYVFIAMTALGVILGLLYDAFSVKRSLIIDNALACFVDDVIFVFISGVLFLICAFITNNGIIRWFEFASCFSGFIVYKLTVSKIIMKFMRFITVLIRRIIKKIFNLTVVIIKPFFLFFNKIINIVLCPYIVLIYEKSKIATIMCAYHKMCRIGK